MLVQEGERADAVDGVRTVEELDLRPVADAQQVVTTAGLRELIGHPLIGRDPVVMRIRAVLAPGRPAREHPPRACGEGAR